MLVMVDLPALIDALDEVGLGRRVWGVLREIVSNMEINGKATPNWVAYRKRDTATQNNLTPILKAMEDRQIICRDVDNDGAFNPSWSVLWVNPGLIYHNKANEKYLESQKVRFMKKYQRILAYTNPTQSRSW